MKVMKLTLALSVVHLAFAAHAMTLDVPRLSTPVFADREVSGDAIIPANAHENLHLFRAENVTADAADERRYEKFRRMAMGHGRCAGRWAVLLTSKWTHHEST